MGDVAGAGVAVGGGERLHQLPAGEVGHAGVADLAGPDQLVQGAEHLLDGGGGVEGVQLEEVEVVGAEAAQGGVDGGGEAGAGGAGVVGAVAGGQAGLGGDQHLVAAALDRPAEDLLGGAVGVDVGGVEEGDAGVDGDVEQAAGLGLVGGAPGAEQRAPAAEGAGAEGERGR